MEYRREEIASGLDVFVSESCTFGSDALLLGRFATLKAGDRVFDLGAGCGIVGAMLFSRTQQPSLLTAVEFDADAVKLAELTAQSPAISGRMSVVKEDIRQISVIIPPESADLVVTNPPFFERGRGRLPAELSRRNARSDLMCTATNICDSAAHLLRAGGRLALCQRPENILVVTDAMRKAGIEPKRIVFAAHSPMHKPFLFLCEGAKAAKPGLAFEHNIFISHTTE